MSWDLMVFDFQGTLSDPETGMAVFPDSWEPPIIGDAHTIRTIISGALSQVSWADPTWGTVDGPDFSLELSLGNLQEISNFAIHARGHATPTIMKLVSATGWKILDTTTGKWINETSNPGEGQDISQRYLNTILDTKTTR